MGVSPLWFVTDDGFVSRRQSIATSDQMNGSSAGTAIPDWTYSTGFVISESKIRCDGIFLENTKPIRLTLNNSSDTSVGQDLATGTGEFWIPGSADYTGYKMRFMLSGPANGEVRRLLYTMEKIASR